LKNELVIFLEGHGKPASLDEISAAFPETDSQKLSQALQKLEEAGELLKTRKNKYALPEQLGFAIGRMQGHSRGFGFVVPNKKGMGDIFISAENLNGAMHNDTVMARLLGIGAGKKEEGEVVKVITRANKRLVGTFETGKHFGFVTPDDNRLPFDVFIPGGEINRARSNDKVVVEITRWPEKRRNPEGRVTEVIGRKGEPGTDVTSVIRKFDLPEQFPGKVLAEAERFAARLTDADLKGRQDLRSWSIVTIDGADARDLDDGVSIRKTPGKGYQVGVHIADVGYYVKEGSDLDKEAFNRGTSVYLVDRVVPMLPPKLSNDLCSLTAKVDRLAMTVVIEIDLKGKVTKHRIFPSVIRVRERMTYEDVRKIIVDKDAGLIDRYHELVDQFETMAELAMILRERRFSRGAIDFNFAESKVILDESGKPAEIKKVERSIADQVIEEFMILANEVVAEHMFSAGVPFLYRVHEEPTEDSLSQLNTFLKRFGVQVRRRNQKVSPRSVQDVLRKVSGRPEERFVSTVVLRSLKHARYDPSPLGHFGLASQYYSHFTSPIRRYPDLVIHRVIREVVESGGLSDKRKQALAKKMPAYAERSSEREKQAEEAERETVALKKVEYMQRHVGDVFPGTVSGVTPFGMFVELENTVEGLVHVASLGDDFYRFIEEELSLVGERARKRYRIGDRVTVLVVRVNPEDKQIDFELVEE